MFRRLTLAFVVVSVAATLLLPTGTSATPSLSAKNLVLRVTDFAEGTTVTSEENSQSSLLRSVPATNGYAEVLSVPGVGAVANSAIVAKTAHAAKTFITEEGTAVATPASRAEWVKALVKNFQLAGLPLTSASVVRHRRLEAGDGATEIVAQLSVGKARLFVSELFVTEGLGLESLAVTAVSPISSGRDNAPRQAHRRPGPLCRAAATGEHGCSIDPRDDSIGSDPDREARPMERKRDHLRLPVAQVRSDRRTMRVDSRRYELDLHRQFE